jgi:HNH endonuclease
LIAALIKKDSSMKTFCIHSNDTEIPQGNNTKVQSRSSQIELGLSSMSDERLIAAMDTLAHQERELLTVVLRHLREIDFRRLFCDLGYPSLFEYAVRRLGYSHDQAARRIAAMRLIKSMPEVEEKIASGSLNLTNAAAAHRFFQNQKRMQQHKISQTSNSHPVIGTSIKNDKTNGQSRKDLRPHLTKEAKQQLIRQLENTSTREAEKIMAGLHPHPQPNDRIRAVGKHDVEIRFTASTEVEEKLKHLKGLIAHSHPNITLGELINKLADLGLKEWDPGKTPKRKTDQRQIVQKTEPVQAEMDASNKSSDQIKSNSLGAPRGKKRTNARRKHLSIELRRQVWRRDGGKCCGCGSIHALEVDHRIPLAMGGGDTLENLRLLCRTCNQRAAIRTLGAARMGPYLSLS